MVRTLFSRSLVVCVVLPSLAFSAGVNTKSKTPKAHAPKTVAPAPAVKPKAASPEKTPHASSAPSSSQGTKNRPVDSLFGKIPVDYQQKAKEREVSFPDGLKGEVERLKQVAAAGDAHSTKVVELMKTVTNELEANGIKVDEATRSKIEQAIALLMKQQELGSTKVLDAEVFEKIQNFVKTVLTDKQVKEALKASGIKEADFIANMLVAFRQNPDSLKVEMEQVLNAFKNDPETGKIMLEGRATQASVFATAFNQTLGKGKSLAQAQEAGEAALNKLYKDRGLSAEDIKKLNCDCSGGMVNCNTGG